MASIFVINRGSLGSFFVICFLTVLVYLLVSLNIFFAQQIIGFIYFSFVPGILIIGLIGLSHLGKLEKVLISVGLSIAYLMFVGLLINTFGPYLGIPGPLSTESLSLTICSSIILLAFANYWKNRKSVISTSNLNTFSWARILLLVLLPTLGIIGAILVNLSGSNWVLLVTILAIVGVFTGGVLSKRLLPEKYYSIALFMISLALLFYSTLISNYIQGADVHLEYYVFRLTQTQSYWDPSYFFGTFYRAVDAARYHSMLSITILGTEYSNLLGMDATWTLKIIYPLLFALVPIGLYAIVKEQFGEKIAFVSAFILMAEQNFLLLISLAREMIGELFFLLLFLVIFNKKMSASAKNFCFAAFGIALVVSHYALAIIFLFFLLFIYFFGVARKKPLRTINISMVLLFSVIMLAWFIFVNNAASFQSFYMGIASTLRDLNQFFVPSSRGDAVLTGVGVQSAGVTTLQTVSRIFSYLLQFLIVIGTIALVTKKRGKNLDIKYKLVIVASALLLASTILLPGVALSLSISRFFHISLLFLAPMVVLGCDVLASLLFKRSFRKRAYAITLLVIIIIVPYFLFQTNFIYEVNGHETWSVPLSIYRMGVRPYTTEFGYVQKTDVFAAQWLNSNTNTSAIKVYADTPSIFNVLTSYGMVPRDYGANIVEMTNTTIFAQNSTVFLSRMNIENGLFGYNDYFINQSDIKPIFNYTNTIYSNGYSEIAYAPVTGQPVG